jgi:UDP-N-acetylmuramate dehydrogenase
MNAGCYGQNMGKVVEEVRVLDDRGEAVALPVGQLGFAYRHSRIKGSGDIVLSAGLRLEPGHDPAQIEAETRALFGKKRVSQPIGERCAGSVFLSPPGESASRMIDEAGLKGTRCGGAVVSMKHAGFIVNDRGASADDVLRLIDVVRDRVGREFGVSLDLEVEVVGDA